MQLSWGTTAMLWLQLKALCRFQYRVCSKHFFSQKVDSLKLFIYSKTEEDLSWSRLSPGSFWKLPCYFKVWGCLSAREQRVRTAFVPCAVEVALATAHGLLNAKVNNGKRHAYTIILIISCCPQAVITYTPYFPNVSNLFLMSRIISYVKLPFAASHASSFTTATNEVTS